MILTFSELCQVCGKSQVYSYSYALICGYSRSYLWILARQPELSKAIIAFLTTKAKVLGFDTDALIYVQQKNMANKQVPADVK